MEVSNRFNAEVSLQQALAVVWKEWSATKDPAMLTKERLTELLEYECQDSLWAVWIAGNLNALDEYGQAQDEAALMAAFLIFFNRWKEDVATRWGARVDEYNDDANYYGGGGGGGGGGSGSGRFRSSGPTTHFATLGDQVSFTDEVFLRDEETDDRPEKLPWSKAKDEILTEADFTREAVTTVTETHTDAEQNAVQKIQASGQMLIAIWQAEPGACPVCEKLHGSRPVVWRAKAPKGPPIHPHCRCWLLWVRIENTSS